MSNKVIRGLFALTILGLVGLLVLTGSLVALAQTGENDTAVDVAEDVTEETAEDVAAPYGMFMRGFHGAGFMGDGGGCDYAGWMDRDAMREMMHTALADALGMSVDELEAALAEGVSPRQLIEEAGLNLDAIQAARQAARDQALAEAVADGRLTQEEADLLRERQGLMQQRRQEMRQWDSETAVERRALMQQRREEMRQWHEENGMPAEGMMQRRGMQQRMGPGGFGFPAP